MKTDTKILFTGAITGGRINQPNYALIIKKLEQYGTVFSRHIAEENMGEYGETNITKEEIHDREMEALRKSDLLVAEVTTSSLGAGYLIAQAVNLNKKVIALYNGEDTMKLSGMIVGDKNVKVYAYQTEKDLEEIFSSLI